MIDKNKENPSISPQKTLDRAGNAVVALASHLLEHDLSNLSIVVLAGPGLKGCVGLAAAYQLWQAGAWVQVLCSSSTEQVEDEQAELLHALRIIGVPFAWAEEGWELPPCDLLIEAILDTTREPVRGRQREMILLANSSAAPILSIAAPSGVDATTGHCFSPHITAAATIMLGLPTTGLLLQSMQPICGDLYLADIGMAAAIYLAHGFLAPPIFADNGLLKLANS